MKRLILVAMLCAAAAPAAGMVQRYPALVETPERFQIAR